MRLTDLIVLTNLTLRKKTPSSELRCKRTHASTHTVVNYKPSSSSSSTNHLISLIKGPNRYAFKRHFLTLSRWQDSKGGLSFWGGADEFRHQSRDVQCIQNILVHMQKGQVSESSLYDGVAQPGLPVVQWPLEKWVYSKCLPFF